MTKQEIRSVLNAILEREGMVCDTPTENEWRNLEAKFATVFPPEFRSFIELMSEYSFPGDILNVSTSAKSNGNDTIEVVYDSELQNGNWPRQLIPFYGIGNGDYFSIDANEGIHSAVYYRYHEDGKIEKFSKSFSEWISNLPKFLKGE